MKRYFYLLFSSIIACNSNFQLQEGDLLFQDLDSSPLCDAIELVTPGYNGANLSHIGLIVVDNNNMKVLEATPPNVKLTEKGLIITRAEKPWVNLPLQAPVAKTRATPTPNRKSKEFITFSSSGNDRRAQIPRYFASAGQIP